MFGGDKPARPQGGHSQGRRGGEPPHGAMPSASRTPRGKPAKPPFFTPFTIKKRRRLTAAIIITGLIASTAHHSGAFQSAVTSVRETVTGVVDSAPIPKPLRP